MTVTNKLSLLLILLVASTISSGQDVEFNVKLSKPTLANQVNQNKKDTGYPLIRGVPIESADSQTKNPKISLSADVSLKVVPASQIVSSKKRSSINQPVCKMKNPLTKMCISTCTMKDAKKKRQNQFSKSHRAH